MSGEIEFDESYFDARCKSIRGYNAAGKVPVLGLLERNGYAHTKIILNATAAMLEPILREKVWPHSLDYTNAFRAHDVFKDRSALVELLVRQSEQAISSPRRLSHQKFSENILKFRGQIFTVCRWLRWVCLFLANRQLIAVSSLSQFAYQAMSPFGRLTVHHCCYWWGRFEGFVNHSAQSWRSLTRR